MFDVILPVSERVGTSFFGVVVVLKMEKTELVHAYFYIVLSNYITFRK